ncbi:hypothetical protein ACF0H5_014415 [Mactra antiquata]
MELTAVCDQSMTRENSCETTLDKYNVRIEQNTDIIVETIEVDKDQGIKMRDDSVVERSITMNTEVSKLDVDNTPCVNISIDNSKDESDCSDYGEENTTCHLANQAVRAKLLSSVVNPANGTDSKLRVSVFDHRIIPKKFIVPKRSELKSLDLKSSDNESGNKMIRNHDGCVENGQDNRKKLSNLSYTVLKASKRYNNDNKCNGKSPTSPESDNDVRTRFDILLRNLIGDVNEMKVEPTTVTVSSGYESDYTQNRNVDNKNNKVGITCYTDVDTNKENILQTNSGNNVSTNYLSETGTGKNSNINSSLNGFHGFSSLPSFPTQYQDQTGTLPRSETGDVPLVKLSQVDKDSKGFSYAQRHNYKLTKVTRSMYEIIHDLQNGEKVPNDGRKRSKKGRRSSNDPLTGSTDGLSSAGEGRSRGRIQSNNGSTNNKSESVGPPRYSESNTSTILGSVVRCVRRPLCSEVQPIQRKLSHSDNGNRLVGTVSNNNSNKVQNDLRNLLCGSSDVTVLSADDNEHQAGFNTLSGCNNTQSGFSSALNGHVDNGFSQTNGLINDEQNITLGQRRPTLNEQFMNRPKPDDHVYETIPGDEKFYEEWKKMQQNTKIPKIRRFTTIPDLPGTFIPKEPPALPERKYLCSNEPVNKDTDNYIFMGDVNSNFPPKSHITSKRSDSGFGSVASDNFLDKRPFQSYPYPINDVELGSQLGRTDETSDGYCSIDNLSLSRDIPDTSFPVPPSSEWRDVSQQSLPRRLPPPRNDYFFSSMDRDEYKKQFSSNSYLHSHPFSRENSFDANRTKAPSAFEEVKKPVFQATYV